MLANNCVKWQLVLNQEHVVFAALACVTSDEHHQYVVFSLTSSLP